MNRTSIFFCVLFAIIANFIAPAVKAQVNTTDSLTLVDLYNSTNGNNWYRHTNWLTTAPVSTWYGVKTNANRVTSLALAINGLSGILPVSIGNLDSLNNLDLQSNRLGDTIPASIGNLRQLTYLNLGYSNFGGSIPNEIGNLTKLDSLSLLYNHLTGPIPASIGNCVNLQFAQLVENDFTGAIPAEIGNCVNLTFLNLNINQLSGSIPSSIGNCVKLQTLTMFSNQLSGTIPSSVGNLVNLEYLGLNNNQLSGSIPSSIGNCIKLQELQLYYNQLSGGIPSSIGNLRHLIYLTLDNNQLSGSIPSSIGNLTNVTSLRLNNNQLSGAIPIGLHYLNPAATINLSYNRLTQSGNIHASVAVNHIRGTVRHNLFTFNGLETFAAAYPNIQYAPQDTILPIHQSDNTLSVVAGGTLANNTYTWHRAGTADSTIVQKNAAFTPSSNGMYYATVTNKIAPKLTLYSDTLNFTLSPVQQSSNMLIVKATQPATVIQHMQIYPNPASSTIHIQTAGTATITLTNSAGKILLTKTINNNDAINVSKYTNGTYYIQNKTTGETEKVVVIH